ncbi:hypothetical protein N7478_008410 [Penicillium angulare]|uniref:uncharacterized protein n=1 Tax=Penicillium angulare TaxID=116970 RepID=UPI00254218CC|nr:uncharacterized protein N7478_008410 [Penicillium angulare]KAJ5273285.1 hypothetical protein N7478_008410 [Penicillium angulare]
MGFLHTCILISTALAAVHARFTPRKSISCSSLAGGVLGEGYNVTDAEDFAAGSVNASGIINQFSLCRVQGTLTYGPDDVPVKNGANILIWEIYLPSSDYNGRFMVVGNGGYAGYIDEESMMVQLNLGYATAGCDSGHSLAANGNTAYAPFLANKAETGAWIHNSIALTTAVARTMTTKYYEKAPEYSYYYGCSTGGAQGFALAQYYPDLFDGIYAGSPGNWYSHLVLSFLWNGLHTTGTGYMTQDALDFITDSVVSACDAIDGVVDGLIENPLLCDYNIANLECAAGQSSTDTNGTVLCLTSAQIQAAEAVYTGPKNLVTGDEVYPGLSLGSENGWIDQETVLYETYTALILKEVVFRDLAYNVSSFNWGKDVSKVDAAASPLIDEISTNLSSFQKRGGKLIVTQGWADQFNAATWPIQHLEQIQTKMGAATTDSFLELFMVPGGGHCGSNPGYTHVPGTYNVIDVLVPWVEQGIRPTEMMSVTPPDGTNTTRKLCPWPNTAHYVKGNIDDWTSYTCS